MLLILFCQISTLKAQAGTAKDTIIQIETKDGNEYVGTIVSEDSATLTLSTAQFGMIKIPVNAISRRVYVGSDRLIGNEIWLENPQAARYFYMPTGYGLHRGEWYYQNIWVLFNQMSVGLSDHFSVGVGVVPLFLFEGAATPIWITSKFSIPVVENKFNVGIGAIAGRIVEISNEMEGRGLGICYGVATFGSKDKNASFGLGYGYVDGELAESPTINFSALIRGGRNFYFVTENYYYAGDGVGFLSVGGRSMIRNASIDYGLVVPVNVIAIAVPWLGFAVPFYPGNSKPASF